MFRKLTKLQVLVSGLAIALVAYGCDSATEPRLAPEGTGPSEAPFYLVTTTTFSNGYKMVVEDDPAVGSVEGVIDENGGELVLFKHKLSVPAGAVSAPTTFRIEKTSPDALRFKLTATRLLPNDVGVLGFAERVHFGISYADATVSNPTALKVTWVMTSGFGQFQDTSIDLDNKVAWGYLNHFSDYALIVP